MWSEISNTTETLLNDKTVACAKCNCLIHAVSRLITCLLLFDICVNCCFYYAKYQSKQLFHNISIKLGRFAY